VHDKFNYKEPLIIISSAERARVVLQNSIFHDNYLMTGALFFESSVGSLHLINNVFYNEIIRTYNNYMTLTNLYQLVLKNCTFTDMNDDKSDKKGLTDLISISSVDLDGEGEFSMTSLKMTNISLTLLTLSTFTGTPKAKKTILFDDIVFTNAAFATRNDFITIGPHVSSRNFEIVMKNFDFQNLLFENTAYAVNIKMQIPNAIRIENFSYSNITGGFINLEPVSVSHDIDPVKVEMKNITALNNDFKFNTFIILRDYSHLTVDT
jgi:hypothetical protein